MGARHSKTSAPRPAPEPTALLSTSAGVIVRVSDPATGESSFHHNPRFLQPETLSDALQASSSDFGRHRTEAQDVVVVKAGARNSALQNKVVFVKKPLRPQPSPHQQTRGE